MLFKIVTSILGRKKTVAEETPPHRNPKAAEKSGDRNGENVDPHISDQTARDEPPYSAEQALTQREQSTPMTDEPKEKPTSQSVAQKAVDPPVAKDASSRKPQPVLSAALSSKKAQNAVRYVDSNTNAPPIQGPPRARPLNLPVAESGGAVIAPHKIGPSANPEAKPTPEISPATRGAATLNPTAAYGSQAAAVSQSNTDNPQEREIRMSDAQSVLAMLKEKEAEYVDLRFTDPRGKLQHVTVDIGSVDEDMFADGIMFDGSSIAGWKAINESDMVLMPDPSTAVMDPFYAQNTVQIFCDILEPGTGEPYNRDPRSTAKKAMAYLAATGIGDNAYFGPEAEFFVFDDVRFEVSPHRVAAEVDSADMMSNSWTEYETGNMGHRPRVKGGYFPVNPIDSGQDMRSEMLSTMKKMGVPVEKHHHEVASAQHELGYKFGAMVKAADNLQLYKYCIHNVAHAYGKSATFMPKPVKDDNGTGMHVHQSIWKDGQPLFAGNQYADLSEECLHYIGGVLRHAKALNAFTNPSTNSYKRLIPGFEAPVLLAYSARNRSAACRIPYSQSPKGKRIETRFPDPTANPYLAFAALMMAGLDGIENKIHPGEPMDKDLYALPPEELKDIPTVCGSLREALDALATDHGFLLKGGVFTTDQIEAYAELKWEEVYNYEHTPHPAEFDMYYSV